jgi:hypothetical protein
MKERTCAFYLCGQTFALHPSGGGWNRLYCSAACKKYSRYPEEAARKTERRRAQPKACRICGSQQNLMTWRGHPINKCRPCGAAIIKLTMLRNGRMKLKGTNP